MRFEIEGAEVFASTGGRQHRAGQDWIVFIHGAGQSHLTWNQQVRGLSYDGYNILALDLPAHGMSTGRPLETIEKMARWVEQVFDTLEIRDAHLVGHSMGGLVTLELASEYSGRVKSAVFVATAMTIAVGEPLIKLSKSDPQGAFEFMISLSHGPIGHLHDNSVPGGSLIGSGLRIMGQNQRDTLPADLAACLAYQGGQTAAANVSCPNMCLLAELDRMIGLKFGRRLSEALAGNELHIFQGAGHMLPAERPREINAKLRGFYDSNI